MKVNLTAAVQRSATDPTFIFTSLTGSGSTGEEALAVIRASAQSQANAATTGAQEKQDAAAALAQ